MQGETSSGFVSVSQCSVAILFLSSDFDSSLSESSISKKRLSLLLERRNECLENILDSYAFLAHENIIIL